MIKEVHNIEGEHIQQLLHLFQQEWWSKNRTLPEVEIMLQNTPVLIGIVDQESDKLIAFCRVVTDGIFKALVMDVIVLENHRKKKLGTQLMERILAHPKLSAIKHFDLNCLPNMVVYYEKFGFKSLNQNVNLMRNYIREEDFV